MMMHKHDVGPIILQFARQNFGQIGCPMAGLKYFENEAPFWLFLQAKQVIPKNRAKPPQEFELR